MRKDELVQTILDQIARIKQYADLPVGGSVFLTEGHLGHAPHKVILSSLPLPVLKEGKRWLLQVIKGELEVVRVAFNNSTNWELYEAMDLVESDEFKHLKQSIKTLRAAIRKSDKPDLFKKGKINAILKAKTKAKRQDAGRASQSPE